jgi:DNA-binding GntR family transcriptional regulator
MTEHRAIADRVIEGDAAGAAQAMRAHLETIFDAIANIASENAHYFTDSGAAPPTARRA